jgi:hypothetical protein
MADGEKLEIIPTNISEIDFSKLAAEQIDPSVTHSYATYFSEMDMPDNMPVPGFIDVMRKMVAAFNNVKELSANHLSILNAFLRSFESLLENEDLQEGTSIYNECFQLLKGLLERVPDQYFLEDAFKRDPTITFNYLRLIDQKIRRETILLRIPQPFSGLPSPFASEPVTQSFPLNGRITDDSEPQLKEDNPIELPEPDFLNQLDEEGNPKVENLLKLDSRQRLNIFLTGSYETVKLLWNLIKKANKEEKDLIFKQMAEDLAEHIRDLEEELASNQSNLSEKEILQAHLKIKKLKAVMQAMYERKRIAVFAVLFSANRIEADAQKIISAEQSNEEFENNKHQRMIDGVQGKLGQVLQYKYLREAEFRLHYHFQDDPPADIIELALCVADTLANFDFNEKGEYTFLTIKQRSKILGDTKKVFREK